MGVADSEGVALALPMAIAGSAPMGVDWDAYTRPASSNPDLRLVADTRSLLVSGGVDARRVFLAGQSQGGYLAFYAGMTFSTLFGAVNVSAAGDPMPGLGLAAMATRRIPVDLLTGDGDFAIANIRSTRDDLQRRGFDVRYTELAGVGHCCPLSTRTGTAPAMWLWLSARPLP
jgi:poly(3-hydroxybutyrate) depolymerase